MNNKVVTTMLSAVALSGVAMAGETVAQAPVEKAFCPCDALQNIGKIYADDTNPYIQSVTLTGRAQYQWAYVDGRNNGADFNGNGDEMRRLRIGADVAFLNGFFLKSSINLNDTGDFRSVPFGFDTFDELILSYNFGEVAGFEDVTLGYGRYKHTVTEEVHTSSKKIKTLERSNISNYFFNGAYPTGSQLSASKGDIDYTVGLYTTDGKNDTRRKAVGHWNDGVAYYFNAKKGGWNLDLFYDNAEGSDDDEFGGQSWVSSLAYTQKLGNWELMTNGIFGNSQGDAVYGLVVMPSTYLVADKLEAVFRYQFAGSSEDNLKASSRYIRRVESTQAGDLNHTLYAGLNYYLCGHNAKVMTGLEFETLRGSTEDLEAVTFSTGFRMFF